MSVMPRGSGEEPIDMLAWLQRKVQAGSKEAGGGRH
jgi:hypothetical protein